MTLLLSRHSWKQGGRVWIVAVHPSALNTVRMDYHPHSSYKSEVSMLELVLQFFVSPIEIAKPMRVDKDKAYALKPSSVIN